MCRCRLMAGVAALAIAQPHPGFAYLRKALRAHDGVVELFRGRDVGDGDGNVIEHGLLQDVTNKCDVTAIG